MWETHTDYPLVLEEKLFEVVFEIITILLRVWLSPMDILEYYSLFTIFCDNYFIRVWLVL